MAAADPQSKKWQLTINNPQTCGLDRDRLLDILNQFSLDYFALRDEVGANGTPHTHIFLCAHSNLRFSTIQRKLSVAHIEKALGTAQQNRDYMTKTGKWADTKKAETTVELLTEGQLIPVKLHRRATPPDNYESLPYVFLR